MVRRDENPNSSNNKRALPWVSTWLIHESVYLLRGYNSRWISAFTGAEAILDMMPHRLETRHSVFSASAIETTPLGKFVLTLQRADAEWLCAMSNHCRLTWPFHHSRTRVLHAYTQAHTHTHISQVCNLHLFRIRMQNLDILFREIEHYYVSLFGKLQCN